MIVRGGHKISDSGETHRNEYLLCKNFKTGFRFFVTRTVFSHQLCPRSPRTGSASGCVGRVGDKTPFEWQKIRNQFWSSCIINIHSWESRLDQSRIQSWCPPLMKTTLKIYNLGHVSCVLFLQDYKWNFHHIHTVLQIVTSWQKLELRNQPRSSQETAS